MNMFYKTSCISALLLISVVANATVVKSNYSVDAYSGDGNGTDSGLVIQTAHAAANPFTSTVTQGNPVTFDLFDIWTDENSLDNDGFLGLGCGDDCDSKSISVDFSFLLPQMGDTTVGGTTQGQKILGGLSEKGKLTWNGPADFMFGPLNDGQLQVSLSNETFNKGIFGLNEGKKYGATVQATLTQLSDPRDVPEPGTFALFGLAMMGVGIAASRRRRGTAPRLSI